MRSINGFTLESEFGTKNAGFCKWAFATREAHHFFIKEFLSPKYPEDDCGLSPAIIARKRAECEQFYQEKKQFYLAVRACRTGNITMNHSFFRWGSRYYAASERVYPSDITPMQIAALPEEKKLVLIRALLYSFAELHAHGVIHADVKPDNVLIKKTSRGYYTGKIIDFDSGFLESNPPLPDDLQGDQVYLSPEARLYMMERSTTLSTKMDVFALGLLIHQYWCGALPEIPAGYDYAFEAVLDGKELVPSTRLPEPLREQVRQMLLCDSAQRPGAAEVLHLLAGSREDEETIVDTTDELQPPGFFMLKL